MKNTEVIICDLDHKDIKEEKEVFNNAGIEVKWLKCKTQQEVIENCRGAKVLLNQYVKMDKNIFEHLPEVKCIVRYGVGVDNVDLDDACKYGVQVCNVPDYGVCEVADHAMAHMMALTRKIVLFDRIIRDGVWDYQKAIPIRRFKDITIGVYGVGRIGTEFAKLAHSLGSRIIANDSEFEKPGREFPDFVQFLSFEELLEQSDIISIHTPLNKETYHRFSDREFNKMKNSAYIINVARGGIIDEKALFTALKNKEIAGAGIDVTEFEPMEKTNPLLTLDNFIVSPHAAWYSEESASELKTKAATEAVRFINNIPVKYAVNVI